MPSLYLSVMGIYDQYVLGKPIATLISASLFIVLSSIFISDFKLDASADSIVLENDAALKYYRSISARYSSNDFLVVTYTPKAPLFSSQTLQDIKELRDEFRKIERIESVTSLLDVPLIDSPRVTLPEIQKHVRTLGQPDTDIALAKKEFLSSPLYKNLILSPDAKTTAMRLIFKRDETYHKLLSIRDQLREKQLTTELTSEEQQQLKKAAKDFKAYTTKLSNQGRTDIMRVRAIMDKYRDKAKLHLGGVPMIVVDMIAYIRNDLKVFGIGVFLFLLSILAIAFKKPRWVIFPMVVCFASVIVMIGYLGMVDWRITVVSSNFISLMLILTLSLAIHLIVRHRELHSKNPDESQRSLVRETVRSKLVPSFYTAITTMVAFGSLLVSGIRPVIDFGWIMVIGISIAFILTFIMFPAGLMLLKPGIPPKPRVDIIGNIMVFFSHFIEKRRTLSLGIFGLLMILSIIGISSLSVENRFIDYFKSDTEIYQGMSLIDKELGGTTPLDVIIDPDKDFYEFLAEEAEFKTEEDDPVIEGEAGMSGSSYWYDTVQIDAVTAIHEYLESLPETGKVLSLATTMKMLKYINEGESFDNLTLAVMYKRLPKEIKATLFDPYLSADGNQTRISMRIIDSDPELNRDELVTKIKTHLVEKLGYEENQVQLTGMVVLYNNMLQSLFRSQILTIGAVFIAILLMFVVLFRSIILAFIAIVPNIAAAALVLGLMGLLGISLDMMTITIAAITIGIAVDDTIHYIHRFREEYRLDGSDWGAVQRSHGSIGRAMFYTSVTITLGFSILALSNFIPTIYFGLLTGFAMMMALLANITILPLLLVIVKPLKV